MSIDLRNCDQACMGCVKSYKKKHDKDSKFSIICNGIPNEYVTKNVLATLDDQDAQSAIAMLDPVAWAAQVLDWHCLDLDGEVWKRKSRDNTLPTGTVNYYRDIAVSEARVRAGKSPFHRPYQAIALRCTARRKVFRWGRQIGKSEVLIISILFALFTNKNFKIILIAPFQAQVEMIFTRIEEHLNNNSALSNSKRRLVKAPQFTLELHNGSFIRAFTAGTQSKSNAGAARGQSANMLIFDEADMLSDGDITATLAMIANFPDATVVMSSTPTGKRERFWEACNSKLYKESHYTSHMNPNWNDELEMHFRSEYTDIAYQHEILAEFGDQQEGVFQVAYINSAKTEYTYVQMSRQNGWHYCIGVDWNDMKIGTTVSVVGFNPVDHKFYVVDRQVVSREGWSQLAACDFIAKMNRKWIPEWIYVDRGFGATSYEVLRKFGYDQLAKYGANHIDARLARVVKQYDFGSQVEIRDPFTKLPVKKHSKPFLVENAVRRFETHTICFPISDKQLEAEILGYIVNRVTNTGVPVYKQSNEKVGDHNLDALMLALVAFTLEMTDFGKPHYSGHITFAGKFGSGEPTAEELGMSFIVKQDPQYLVSQEKAKRMPDISKRTSEFEEKKSLTEKSQDKLPASNTNIKRDSKIGIWSWKGFSRDEPKPQRKIKISKLITKPPGRKKF